MTTNIAIAYPGEVEYSAQTFEAIRSGLAGHLPNCTVDLVALPEDAEDYAGLNLHNYDLIIFSVQQISGTYLVLNHSYTPYFQKIKTANPTVFTLTTQKAHPDARSLFTNLWAMEQEAKKLGSVDGSDHGVFLTAVVHDKENTFDPEGRHNKEFTKFLVDRIGA
jgi:hypothetical protein